ncbi:uncharacterized protein LOC135822844 [Sycon ciliatum]|uniref:uncharacterized protein LOC135822844 n=1 Tax=Sycon ciliatum TaxID=27933 RepID=UPI0020AEC55F|eukprot:scpid65406/ scgid19907/ 
MERTHLLLVFTVVAAYWNADITLASPQVSTKNGHITIATDANKNINIKPGPGGKVYLSDVVMATASPGTGSSGSSSGGSGLVSSGQCLTDVLPKCPYWVSFNTTMVPARGYTRLEFITFGFGDLYNTQSPPSYACQISSSRQTLISEYTRITMAYGPYYVIVCTVPEWTFADSKTFSEPVTISLWFLGQVEIPFVGLPQWQTATMYTGVTGASMQVGSVELSAAGLDTSLSYVCRFSDALITTQYADTSPLSASSSSKVLCPIPVWTASTKRSVSTNVDLYIVTTTYTKVPFQAKPKPTFIINSCSDGVKDGDETDVDCGGSCTTKCIAGKVCQQDNDCEQYHLCTAGKCVSKCSFPQWLYKGVCLMSSLTTTNADKVPAGCNDYHPLGSWTKSDYISICVHYLGNTQLCGNVYSDYDGGRCSNFRATLGFSNQGGDTNVWVSSTTFSWDPAARPTPSCKLVGDPPGTIVYACS